MRLLFDRFYTATEPVEKLTEAQRKALEVFRQKLGRGVYAFEEAGCLCGCGGGWVVAARDRFALPVQTLLCPACGVMRTSPRMTGESLGRFYRDDYRPLYVGEPGVPEWFFNWQIENGKQIREFVSSALLAGSERIVFDVGCGAGGTLLPFREAGWRVFGCDTGPAYLERGRREGLTLECGEAPVLERHGPANLVLLSHVLEHLPNPLASLVQLHKLLRPGGFVYVELPGIFSIYRTYRDFLLFLQNAHLYHFTLKTLSALLAAAGFRLVKGDQRIRALYQVGSSARRVATRDQAWRVLCFLCLAELRRRWNASPLWRPTRRQPAQRLESQAAKT
jgi:SAM-dependent methyltransferase